MLPGTIHLLEIMHLSAFKSPLFYPFSQVYLLMVLCKQKLESGRMHAHFQPCYVEQDGTGLTEASVEDSDWYHVSGTVVMVGGMRVQYILSKNCKTFLEKKGGKKEPIYNDETFTYTILTKVNYVFCC